MINAAQDIDYFIERQRSKLNKNNARQGVNRRNIQPVRAGSNENRLDVQVSRILEEPSPRLQPTRQGYVPPSPRPPIDDQISSRSDNQVTFFDSFGTYDEKRAQLKQDLKREYNDFLRNQDGNRTNRKNIKTSTTRSVNNRRVQFKADPTVIAPWEKDGERRLDETFSSSVTEYGIDRSLFTVAREDEAYVRAREEYILELYEQVRELEERRRLLELQSGQLSANVSKSVRSHYAEDLRALNTLLAERLQQRNTVDFELARILNRPPVTGGTNRLASIGFSNTSQSLDIPFDGASSPQTITIPTTNRSEQRRRRPADGAIPLGQEPDKENEQAAKKRYQQELQAQMREAQMRKVQDKQKEYEYEKRLEQETKRYDYFGRSGGGAPMRDRDGNIVANLADLRNPPGPTTQPRSQTYTVLDDRQFPGDFGFPSTTNQQFPTSFDPYQQPTNRSTSPNHARGAVSNGIFGTVKTEEQLAREERYKQDLKRQIEEKRQRELEDIARRRADEEREIAKHTEWLKQLEKQAADDAARKQEKETQERLYQQQLEDERERQRLIEEEKAKRRLKRDERNTSENQDTEKPENDDEQPVEPAYRSSSPPVPTIKNRDKKKKKVNAEPRKETPPVEQSDERIPQSPEPDQTNSMPTIPDEEGPSRTSSRREPAPTRKKPPPPSYRPPRPVRTYSTASLRSDGSDSELLNRLEQLKRQLKDKEVRLQQQVQRQRADLDDESKHEYIPTSIPIEQVSSTSRRPSTEYILKPARLPRGLSPSSNSERLLRVLHNDEDDEFKPSYFRDDSILMRGTAGYISPSKRVDLVDGMFVTNIDDPVRRPRLDLRTLDILDRDNPTNMASLELNRIAEKNELRLKKLRDLESDDTSMLDNNEVLERFQQRQRLRQRGSLTTIHDDAWLR